MMWAVILLALFSCNNKSVKVEAVPVTGVIQMVDEQKPTFKLGSAFEGEKGIAEEGEPFIAPCYKPEVVSIIRAAMCVDTINTTAYIHDTITVQKIVYSRGLAYLMLVIGFVCGMIFCFIGNEVINRNMGKRVKASEFIAG